MTIDDCEGDCHFWETTEDGERKCNYNLLWRTLEKPFGVPYWCPLKSFETT